MLPETAPIQLFQGNFDRRKRSRSLDLQKPLQRLSNKVIGSPQWHPPAVLKQLSTVSDA